MKNQEKRRILFSTVLIGIVCIIVVVLSAYAAELKCENNKLSKENEVLIGEVETLDVKIKAANNVEHIEKIARRKLGMVYPTGKECVYLSEEDTPSQDFAMVIKEKAYN